MDMNFIMDILGDIENRGTSDVVCDIDHFQKMAVKAGMDAIAALYHIKERISSGCDLSRVADIVDGYFEEMEKLE